MYALIQSKLLEKNSIIEIFKIVSPLPSLSLTLLE